jgi:stage II sporulation protein R
MICEEKKMSRFQQVGLVSVLAVIVFGWFWLVEAQQTPLAAQTISPQEVMRFHVLANSDSDRDQQIKYKVRDAIVAYLTPRLEQITSSGEARRIIADNREQLIALADEVLTKEQAGYQARFQMGEFDFPIRSYGTLLFPAGRYEAVRIFLGQGSGQNWWCVLFPPLCFIDGTHAEAVTLTETSIEAAQSPVEASPIQFKSKLAEIIENL